MISRKIIPLLQQYQKDREAIVLTGFRRVGKTTVLQYLYDNLTTTNKLFLDLESPVNQMVFAPPDYEAIKLKLTSLGLDFTRQAFLFLDEVQQVKQIPSVIKYLSDHYRLKCYLTGSSSFYLKNLFTESLSGRKYLLELHPLDFEEFLWLKESRLNPEGEPERLHGLYQEYLEFGGFPAVVLESSVDRKRQRLDDVLGSYFTVDVQHLANFRDTDNLKRLLFLLSSRVGSKAAVNKMSETMGVSRNTIYQYLSFFEQTYLIHLIKPLSGSKDIQLRSLPKLYFNDTGLLNRIGQVSVGQLFENKVFNQLNTRASLRPVRSPLQETINYYQLKTGAEIDFITDQNRALEVKIQATGYDVAKLARTANRLSLADYQVVSPEPPAIQNSKIISPYTL